MHQDYQHSSNITRGKTRELVLESIYDTVPIKSNRDTTIYSDVGAIILGEIVEKISGLPLNVFADSMIFKPLGMGTTFFNLHQIKSEDSSYRI